MKKIIFALPLCAMFAYCSSSRKVTTPPAGPGISNVSVISGKDTVKGSAITVTPENRDWAYKSTRETALQGTWTLDGMVSQDGSWSNTNQWYADTAAKTATDSTSLGMNTSTQTYHSASATMDGKKTGKKTKAKSKLKATESVARYDSLMANSVTYTDSALNASIKPFKYWNRVPSVSLNPNSLVFTGTTGCNSMSGNFNFSGNDIKFNKNITKSKMICNEYNETAFLDLMKKADNYTINNEGKLELRQGTTLLMTFSKQM
jgi:heat shock protein HslJ